MLAIPEGAWYNADVGMQHLTEWESPTLFLALLQIVKNLQIVRGVILKNRQYI